MSFLPSQPEASLIDVFGRWPELARPLHQFAETLMRGDSPFTPGERELIAAFVSTLNGCAYCRGSHREAARHFGVDPELVDACVRDIDASGAPEALKPVLHYCRRLNDDPEAVDRPLVDAVYRAGWDERALCHAALVCGFFNMMNRWVDGLGLPADPRMTEMAGKMLHDKGYAGVSELLDRGPQGS